MRSENPVIVVENLAKSYSTGTVVALDGISMSVDEGEIFGLIGPNGAGKTTLIGCLLGLLRPDSGRVRIFGKDADLLSVRALTGYLPERTEFEHWMTARQFLEYHWGLSGGGRRGMKEAVEEALELVELAESARSRKLRTYSRGMLQRLNLAQLVIGKPRLALLDEPTLGLDPTGVAVVRKIISRMREDGVTAIINSHQLDEVERLCDRVAYLRNGKIVQVETIKGGTITDYVIFVRWGECSLNGTLLPSVQEAALSSVAEVKECNREWGRFRVKDHSGASRLLAELIERGLPVEEAVPERLRLEQLFESEKKA